MKPKYLRMAGCLLLLLMLGTFAASRWLRSIYHEEPRSAYYVLASALERGDKVKLAEIDEKQGKDFYRLAQCYGGISKFGKLLRESPRVTTGIHAPSSVDVVCTVQERSFLIHFVRRNKKWISRVAFFSGNSDPEDCTTVK